MPKSTAKPKAKRLEHKIARARALRLLRGETLLAIESGVSRIDYASRITVCGRLLRKGNLARYRAQHIGLDLDLHDSAKEL